MLRLFFSLALLTALAAPGKAAPGAARKAAVAPAEVSFQFDAREDGDGTPHTKVFLVVGDRRVLLSEATAKFDVLDKKDYKSHGVPATALAACAGWWAGAGEDFYVTRRAGKLYVYSRAVDEQAPVPRYSRLKVIPSR